MPDVFSRLYISFCGKWSSAESFLMQYVTNSKVFLSIPLSYSVHNKSSTFTSNNFEMRMSISTLGRATLGYPFGHHRRVLAHHLCQAFIRHVLFCQYHLQAVQTFTFHWLYLWFCYKGTLFLLKRMESWLKYNFFKRKFVENLYFMPSLDGLMAKSVGFISYK